MLSCPISKCKFLLILLHHPAQSLWLWFWHFEYVLSIAEFCFWGGLALILMKGQVSSLHFIHITFDHFHVSCITVCVCIFQINWTPLCMLNTYWIIPLVNIPFSWVHLHCMFTFDATSLLYLLALYLSCLLRPLTFFQPLCQASFLCHCWWSMDLISGIVPLWATQN